MQYGIIAIAVQEGSAWRQGDSLEQRLIILRSTFHLFFNGKCFLINKFAHWLKKSVMLSNPCRKARYSSMQKKWIVPVVLLTGSLLAGCDSTTTPNEPPPAARKASLPTPDFQADSAYAFIEQQVAFGPRVPNTAAHRECQEYLVNRFTAFGAQVQTQDFEAEAYNGTALQLSNIIASFYPEQRKRILLAAHWDTRPVADKDTQRPNEPIDGANDGASGVGVLLEIARALQGADTVPRVGVDMILFDGEDYGEPEGQKTARAEHTNTVWWCLGSQHWSEYKQPPHYSAYYGILLDMVGAHGATFYQEGVSKRVAPSIVNKVWNTAQQLGFGSYFIPKESPEIVDDHVYVNYNGKIPMIDIVEYEPTSAFYFADYHHTHADNMDIISRETLEAVGETVLHVVYGE